MPEETWELAEFSSFQLEDELFLEGRSDVMVGSARTKLVAELKPQHARISSSMQGCLNKCLFE
jgi:hypothetical protein